MQRVKTSRSADTRCFLAIVLLSLPHGPSAKVIGRNPTPQAAGPWVLDATNPREGDFLYRGCCTLDMKMGWLLSGTDPRRRLLDDDVAQIHGVACVAAAYELNLPPWALQPAWLDVQAMHHLQTLVRDCVRAKLAAEGPVDYRWPGHANSSGPGGQPDAAAAHGSEAHQSAVGCVSRSEADAAAAAAGRGGVPPHGSAACEAALGFARRMLEGAAERCCRAARAANGKTPAHSPAGDSADSGAEAGCCGPPPPPALRALVPPRAPACTPQGDSMRVMLLQYEQGRFPRGVLSVVGLAQEAPQGALARGGGAATAGSTTQQEWADRSPLARALLHADAGAGAAEETPGRVSGHPACFPAVHRTFLLMSPPSPPAEAEAQAQLGACRAAAEALSAEVTTLAQAQAARQLDGSGGASTGTTPSSPSAAGNVAAPPSLLLPGSAAVSTSAEWRSLSPRLQAVARDMLLSGGSLRLGFQVHQLAAASRTWLRGVASLFGMTREIPQQKSTDAGRPVGRHTLMLNGGGGASGKPPSITLMPPPGSAGAQSSARSAVETAPRLLHRQQPPVRQRRHAFVTLLYSDDYAPGVLVLAASLAAAHAAPADEASTAAAAQEPLTLLVLVGCQCGAASAEWQSRGWRSTLDALSYDAPAKGCEPLVSEALLQRLRDLGSLLERGGPRAAALAAVARETVRAAAEGRGEGRGSAAEPTSGAPAGTAAHPSSPRDDQRLRIRLVFVPRLAGMKAGVAAIGLDAGVWMKLHAWALARGSALAVSDAGQQHVSTAEAAASVGGTAAVRPGHADSSRRGSEPGRGGYDCLVFLDADMMVQSPLTHLFDLPLCAAGAYEQLLRKHAAGADAGTATPSQHEPREAEFVGVAGAAVEQHE